MEQNENVKNSGINWHIGIPVCLWIFCVVFGIIKVVLNTDENNTIDFIEIVNAFNSNTFSTFISVVACMIYQYCTTEKGLKREEVSGLSMKNMPATVIISLVYSSVVILDSAISHSAMAIIYCIVSIIYVICFFKIFLSKRKG